MLQISDDESEVAEGVLQGNKRNKCPKTYKTHNTWLRQLCGIYLILKEESNDICAKIFV
jgi:hypothetical protein